VLWNNANLISGLTTRFRKALAGETPTIFLRRLAIRADTNGKKAGLFISNNPGQHITGGIIYFQTDTTVLLRAVGYYKVALHEIGHALGLWHTPEGSGNGSSVMNSMGFVKGSLFPNELRDDYAGNIPILPTKCDREMAKEYSTR
jgi:Matrixin